MNYMNNDAATEYQNKDADTALHIAATCGSTKMASTLVEFNRALLNITNSEGMLPIHVVALFGRREMVTCLYGFSKDLEGGSWTTEKRDSFVLAFLVNDLYDVAIKVLSKNPQPVLTSGDMLRVLARKPRQFDRSNICSLKNHPLNPNSASRFLEINIGKLLQLPRTQESLIYDMLRGPADPPNSTNANIRYSQNVLFLAAEVRNVDFIVRITKGYPQLLRQVNEKNQTIFHVGVKDCIVSTVDSNGNSMLHLAGILNTRSKNKGAALQIQRELLLFKEVGDMLLISLWEKRNDAHLTAVREAP